MFGISFFDCNFGWISRIHRSRTFLCVLMASPISNRIAIFVTSARTHYSAIWFSWNVVILYWRIFFFSIQMKITLRAQHRIYSNIRFDFAVCSLSLTLGCLFYSARFYSFLIFHTITSEQPHQNAHIYTYHEHRTYMNTTHRDRKIYQNVFSFFFSSSTSMLFFVLLFALCIISDECFVVDVYVCVCFINWMRCVASIFIH